MARKEVGLFSALVLLVGLVSAGQTATRPGAVRDASNAVMPEAKTSTKGAVACADLMSLSLAETTITAAHEVAAGPYTPPGLMTPLNNLPAFCRVALTVAPQIKIEVWMPKDTWNQRYLGVGGGGYAGSISYGGFGFGLAEGIRAGYATASTDTGHPASVGGTFALNPDGTLNNQLIGDFAERSLREMVLKAKALINAYYGMAPKYSYWNGCSTGGRQGLMAVQRFPEEYDGLVIAAPAINWDRFHPAHLWPQIVMRLELGGPISAAKLNAVTSAAVGTCDAQDGVIDGVINDPRKCSYNPAGSVCREGSDPATCLTLAEAEAVRKIWSGPVSATTGKRLWFGLERGTSLPALAGSNPFFIALTHLQFWVKQDPAFDWRTLTKDNFEAYFDESYRKFNQVIGTDNPDLRRFRERGGKMILWHGEADQLIFPRGTLNYYQRALEANGGIEQVRTFARLFMAPGVAHCAGGDGPNPVGVFEAVVNWVEKGAAPDRILASRNLTGGLVRTRPLCPYPQTARWAGGSTDAAANFACVDGAQNPEDFKVALPNSMPGVNTPKRESRNKSK
jgi:pimeloyl-ACP methyl ester carboxylesterase